MTSPIVLFNIRGYCGILEGNMRKVPSKEVKLRAPKSIEALDNELQRALQRIEKLERAMAENGLEVSSSASWEPKKRNMGRPRGVEMDELRQRASSLSLWLEDNWPEISLGIRMAKNEQQLAEVFRSNRLNPSVFERPFYKEPERFAGDCWRFIHAEKRSNKYGGNPRNLAAAMAGLPEISPRTSFNRCAGWLNKKGYPVRTRAYRDYLQRKFSDRFRMLLNATSTEEVAKILRGTRSKDKVIRHLRENPHKVVYWLQCGIPALAARSRSHCNST